MCCAADMVQLATSNLGMSDAASAFPLLPARPVMSAEGRLGDSLM